MLCTDVRRYIIIVVQPLVWRQGTSKRIPTSLAQRQACQGIIRNLPAQHGKAGQWPFVDKRHAQFLAGKITAQKKRLQPITRRINNENDLNRRT